jgi:hypothetical protein
MTNRKINIFDKIGSLIPSFQGYATRDNKRYADKQIRVFISGKFDLIEQKIEELKKALIQNNHTQKVTEFEIARKNINTLSSKIKYASYGESSFFDSNQIKEDELEQILQLDNQILERVCLMEVLIQTKSHEEITAVALNQNVKEIEKLFLNRINFIQNNI